MKEFSVSDARQDLPSLIDKSKKEPIVINRHGKPESVLISVEQYEEFLEAFEELDDIAAAEESLRDPGPNIPWEKVKKDLGLK
jgi:prevent-host-death family protein